MTSFFLKEKNIRFLNIQIYTKKSLYFSLSKKNLPYIYIYCRLSSSKLLLLGWLRKHDAQARVSPSGCQICYLYSLAETATAFVLASQLSSTRYQCFFCICICKCRHLVCGKHSNLVLFVYTQDDDIEKLTLFKH